MRKLFLFVSILHSLAFGATPEEEALAKFTQSSNQFGFHLWKTLGKETGSAKNEMLSPFSIESALTLSRLGAAGDTGKEMGEALKLSSDLEKVQIGYWQLIRHLNGEPGTERGFELKSANALWLQIDFPFLPNYLALAQKTFLADLKSVDFKKNAEETGKEINRWVSERTGGKITDIIAPGTLGASNRLVLTNAIYFKGQWTHPFEKSGTKNDKFSLSKSKTASVAFMNKTEQYRYLESDGAQIVEIPYRNSSLAMVVAVPKEITGLKSLENKVNADLIDLWTKRAEYKRAALSLPSFKFHTEYQLEKPLKELGMRLAFSPAADFTGTTKAGNISIDSVVHKTYIGVDEVGTEAAAATAVTYKMTSAPIEERPIVVKVNRPFLFFIKDIETGIILFAGRVTDPR